MKRYSKVMIVDAGYYIDRIEPIVVDLAHSHYRLQQEFKLLNALDYKDRIIANCMIKSVAEVFCLPVIYPRHNIIKNDISEFDQYFYNKVKTLSDFLVFQHVDRQSLSMFNGDEVLCILHNRELILLNHNESIHQSV
jgi:hypothetical protein